MATILVIEDEDFLRNNIERMLQLKGYNCITAANGKLGIEVLQTAMPDIIVCDVMMPEMDGFEVWDNVRNNPKTQLIPFIFLTARADAIDKIRGAELGANQYLTKPFSIVDLLNAIHSILNNAAC
jgi:DNA-binding response OmpR family regulator